MFVAIIISIVKFLIFQKYPESISLIFKDFFSGFPAKKPKNGGWAKKLAFLRKIS